MYGGEIKVNEPRINFPFCDFFSKLTYYVNKDPLLSLPAPYYDGYQRIMNGNGE